jgi:CRISPR-associated protein Cas2
MKYTIVFDIVDDHVRYRAVKILLEYGYRVQKSVFEAYLSSEALDDCRNKLESVINPSEDSVRFYPLCGQCEIKVEIMGVGVHVEQLKYVIL